MRTFAQGDYECLDHQPMPKLAPSRFERSSKATRFTLSKRLQARVVDGEYQAQPYGLCNWGKE
jgi:hypothetical protein